ncbi:hypothetical protein [Clostridium saudiense]
MLFRLIYPLIYQRSKRVTSSLSKTPGGFKIFQRQG